jgi:ketosteroid isomerase-like protein
MPQDAEIPERMLDAWNRRDLEGLLAFADPEIEYVNAPAAVEPGTRYGHEGLTAVVRAQWEGMPGMRQEVDRVHVRGNQVISVGRVSRQMPGSDARVENRILLSWRMREGKIVRLEVLGGGSDFDSALEAAGLGD